MFKRIHVVVMLLVGLVYSAGVQGGWESLENWRKLENGQRPKVVKSILGDPDRIQGGVLTYWHYPNNGEVVFNEGRLDRWNEPVNPEALSDSGTGFVVLMFLLVILVIAVLPLIWVLASKRSSGGAKFGWFILVLCFSWVGFAAFLILTQGRKEKAVNN